MDGEDKSAGNECNCHACNTELIVPMYILCTECGNKRCPKASDHRLDCTGSNKPGQKGSVYE
jgi:hypothetical protein